MTSPKKPSDETIRGLPEFARDDYQDSKAKMKALTAQAAPEVSQGAWRERAFVPRGVMPKDELLAGMDVQLTLAVGKGEPGATGAGPLLRTWLPYLRQAVEQAGGDGLDAWLLRVLKPPGRAATAPFWDALATAFAAVRAAPDPAALRAAGAALIELVRGALSEQRRVSFKVLERELEGKLEVDELLALALATGDELGQRLQEIGSTMETLRAQVKSRPGARPDGMYSNYARLKAELRVVDGELKRRAARP